MFKAIIYDECAMKIIMIRLFQIVMIHHPVRLDINLSSAESDEFLAAGIPKENKSSSSLDNEKFVNL